jgi:hypothetical protein
MADSDDTTSSSGGERKLRKAHIRPRSDSTPDGRASKFAHIVPQSEGGRVRPRVIRCSLPPHKPLRFESLQVYETHYTQNHVNRCFTCQKNFPTEHYLGLHIAENHDPIGEVKRERGEKTVKYRPR